jgi:hypothetical protein
MLSPTETDAAVSRGHDTRKVAVLLAVVVLTVIVGGFIQIGARVTRYSATFGMDINTSSPQFVTVGEMEMIARLDAELDPQGVVLGDSFNGSSHLYGLINQPVVFHHVGGKYTETEQMITDRFGSIASDSELCQTLEELNIRYFYYDSMRYGNYINFAALDFGVDASGMKLIDEGDTAKIYEITRCGGEPYPKN